MIVQTHRELRSDIEKYGRELSGDCRVKRVRVCAQGRDSVVGKCAKIKGPMFGKDRLSKNKVLEGWMSNHLSVCYNKYRPITFPHPPVQPVANSARLPRVLGGARSDPRHTSHLTV